MRRWVRALWLQPADSACAQVLRPDGSLPVQRARARRLDSSLFLQLLVVVRLLRSLSLLPFVGSPPWSTRSVKAVGAEEYGLFLDGLPQLSARPLSNRYACWQERCVLPSWLDTTLRWGHPIQFKRRPPPFMGLVETTLRDPAASTALAAEVARLLVKGAITVVPPHESHLGFYSRYFLVSKKSGEKRPILDLRVFNRFVATRKFRMLTVGALFRCVREDDWFTSLDLKDAYFHVPVRQAHRKFLRFAFMGMAYEYQCLPFGYSLAPRTFSKCVETALEPLRRQGKRILFYLDDLLILSNSEETARRDTMLVINHLSFLGFAINWEKSSPLPSRQTVYLGLCLDSATMTAMLSPPRRDAILSALSRFHVRRNVTALSTMRLLGLMAAAHPVVPLGLLFMRRLQRWFARQRLDPRRHKLRVLLVPRSVSPDLEYWKGPSALLKGVPLGRVASYVVVFTDASLTGWGGTCLSHSVGDEWRTPPTAHINVLELDAVRKVLLHFFHLVRGRHVLIRTDSVSAAAYINRQGGVRSPALHRKAVELWLWAHQYLLSLRALHIAGAQNFGADLMSRGGPRRDEWRLHPDIVRLIWQRFGTAQVDLFASRENTHCRWWFSLSPRDLPPLGVDALAHTPWPRALLYAFPPLQLILPLLERVRQERLSLILVAPENRSALWFPELAALSRSAPWPVPFRPDALSQAHGTVHHPPDVSGRLLVWLLRG